MCLPLIFSPTSRGHNQPGAQTRLKFLAKEGDKDQKIFTWTLLFKIFSPLFKNKELPVAQCLSLAPSSQIRKNDGVAG